MVYIQNALYSKYTNDIPRCMHNQTVNKTEAMMVVHF